MRTILIADDDQSIRRSLGLHLTEKGYAVVTAANGRDAVELALGRSIDVMLLDVRLSGMDGFEILTSIKEQRPSLPVVMVTAHDDMITAIKSIRLGALDHLGKPVDMDHLDEVIKKVFEMSAISRTGVTFCDSFDPPFEQNIMVGRSRVMKEVYKVIGAVADSGATVLIQGESGTGKEMVARALHFNSHSHCSPVPPVIRSHGCSDHMKEKERRDDVDGSG